MDEDSKFTEKLEQVLKTMNVDVKVSNDRRYCFELIVKEEFDVLVINTDIQEFGENNILDFLALNCQLNDQKLILLTKPNLKNNFKNRLLEYNTCLCLIKSTELDVLTSTIMSFSKGANNLGINSRFSN